MADVPLIRHSPVPPSDCNLAKSFDLVGDRWTLLVLRSALYGMRRFDDFQTELNVPRSVLSSRLVGLVKSGLMERREYREDGQRSRTEYFLTEMGRGLGLPFMAMTEWGDRWLGDGTRPLKLTRQSTGQKLRVALVDEKGRVVPASDVSLVIGCKKSKRVSKGAR